MRTLDEPSASLIEVSEEYAGQRIDNFLFARLKGVPKSHVYRILRTGEVRLNGGRIRAHHRLGIGDVLRLPPLRLAPRATGAVSTALIRKRLEPRILYEDADLMIVNKPSGMAVHGGSGLSYGLIEGLRQMRPDDRFLELVHRLDKDTSGCLLIAKKRSALRSLHELFNARLIDKRYLALLTGAWGQKRAIVDAPLRKNVLESGERVVKVSPLGKRAETEFIRRDRFAAATLVEARPVSGRTHQIRVHARHMGHSIAGDERYGDEAANRLFRQNGLSRLFLHASTISFAHPRTHERLDVKADLDQDLQRFLDRLPR
jgi:23S rRNA pseudouridine955/2504/2580 synthase